MKLKHVKLLSSFAFKFNLRRYSEDGMSTEPVREDRAPAAESSSSMVGRCKLNTIETRVEIAPGFSA